MPIQYGDYAKWQQNAVASGSDSRSRGVLEKELAGADFVLDLPHGLDPAGAQDHLGERIAMDGPPGSGDALRALARAERATFFMATLAASGTLLFGLSDKTTSCSAVPWRTASARSWRV